ncbi:S-receptor-like serine/threonine-protein kinase [Trema orientale]|uniref:Receptor-like serine/threonine-protein kinase n=1 Tax=Trema orientale TaxID=63057 RepID=A0A2P5EGN4_TREOI|nr:S-receptor-like serine/threonine-protein kinase [Trema orientale]
MATFMFIFYALSLAITCPFSSSNSDTLSAGSSLSVEKLNADVLTSPNGVFSAGFHPVGENAYCFAVWFNDEPPNNKNRTIVWIANRDQPVNGKRSKLSLLTTNNLILTDVTGQNIVWATRTASNAVAQLKLRNSGNVVLLTSDKEILWQSFDSPTDTLLPEQPLKKLVSSRSQGNFSSGFYQFHFDSTDNLLRLLYNGIEHSSVYWPPPWLVSWDAGRSTYDNSKLAMLDSLGNFSSSDDFTFMSADYGAKSQRRLKIDYDGNLRLYTRSNASGGWIVSWQAFTDSCKIHGICGANSLCRYNRHSGIRKCSCIPGYKMRDHTDWSKGCEPEFKPSCDKNESKFLRLMNTEFYGFDYGFFPNYTLRACQDLCLNLCKCVGYQYSYFKVRDKFSFNCYPKMSLVNGYQSSTFFGDVYLRLPKNYSYSYPADNELRCSKNGSTRVLLPRTYPKSRANDLVKFILWFICGVGGIEMVCFLLVWCFLLSKSEQDSGADMREYLLAATGFKRFSFSELKKATQNFSKEIGRGAGGIVYQGVLLDSRVAAIKKLSDACQGEAEFLAEVNTIGRVNHMNLIEMWGYCAEGKHRLLVYEYLEHGSLSENLSRNVLDWKMRFEIALGTARGLAYLHEECLEWILHCDVKPHNILLGSDFKPKVADFGMSKLLMRGELKDQNFSRIRGTRGYMAPEWVTNQPITSKVDVYSYGIVVLEMLTGKSSTTCVVHANNNIEGTEESTVENRSGLVKWVREKVYESSERETWLGQVMDPLMQGDYDSEKMGILMEVALKCVEEEKDARPTMSQVVEILQGHD